MAIHIHIDANTTPEQEARFLEIIEKNNIAQLELEREYHAEKKRIEEERTMLIARFGEQVIGMLRASDQRAAEAAAEYREHVKNNPPAPAPQVMLVPLGPLMPETNEQRLERERAELARERDAALGGSGDGSAAPAARYPGENTCTCGANPGVDPALHTVGCPTRTHIAPQPNQASSP